jgi:hypothetical protein
MGKLSYLAGLIFKYTPERIFLVKIQQLADFRQPQPKG